MVSSPLAHGNCMPKPPAWVSASLPFLGAGWGGPNPNRGAAGCSLVHSLALTCRCSLWTLVRPNRPSAASLLSLGAAGVLSSAAQAALADQANRKHAATAIRVLRFMTSLTFK